MRVAEHLLLLGPNRRSDRTMVEQHLLPGDRELETLASRSDELVKWLLAQYPPFGVERLQLEDAAASVWAWFEYEHD